MIASLALGSWFLVAGIELKNTMELSADNSQYQSYPLWIGLVMFIVILFCAFCGCMQMATKHCCFSTCFFVSNIITFIFTAALGAFFLWGYWVLPTQIDNGCADTGSVIYQGQDAYDYANQVFCTSYCPCNATYSDFSGVNPLQSVSFTYPDGANQFQECDESYIQLVA